MLFLSKLLLLLLLVLLLLSPSASAQSYQNISLGSNLTTSGTTTPWLSPSGEFAVGFLPVPTNSSLFLLAIWFTKTKEKTIVWYANGNRPVLSGSQFGLTSDGQLLLTDSNGKSVWNPFPSTGSSYAALLDTGNLILASADSTPNWQSFTVPTDTILPIQNLPKNTKLRSHLDDDNYADGRFEFSMQGDGNLVMYPLALPTDSVYSAYWATMTVNTGSQVVFDSSGTLYLELENKSRINVTTSDVSTADFYQRVTLDPDGVLRHYVHPKDAMKKGSWRNDWTVIASEPSDICQRVNGDTGSGACGFNSYCQLNENKSRTCRCPPSYSFLDPGNPYSSCKPDFVAPSCSGGGDQEFFELREMANTDWPGSDYEHYRSFNEDQCRESCMDDCLCAVAIFRGADCWKKRLPLSKGRIGSYVGGKALIKVGTRNTSSFPSPEQQSEKNENDRKVWLPVGLSSLTVSLIILFGSVTALVVLSSAYHRRLRVDSNIVGSSLRCFTYKELEVATKIISCRRNLELELPREEETVLVYWAYDCYKQGRVDALVGNDEEAMTDLDGVLRLLMVAIWCIQEDPSRRPTMKSVWQMLDCAIVVPAPPDPSLIN
ncbi:hypothetical protein J5N97_022733 [Dioscorea zingiberensis]|uniref:Bulb-type lectin domain-containing protein n=1 Tax=Dioscorea zingiberensis TaxID=325984 RepID=A0A9D5HAU9_9LILI|nr:hypothetical protein J5N97_022733 [Dioscorea zingiberensis]